MGRERPPRVPLEPPDSRDPLVGRRLEMVRLRGGNVSLGDVIVDSVIRIGRRTIGGGFSAEDIQIYRNSLKEFDNIYSDGQARRILRVERFIQPIVDARKERELGKNETPFRHKGFVKDVLQGVENASYIVLGSAALLVLMTSVSTGLLPAFIFAGGTFAAGKLLYNFMVQSIVEAPTLLKRLRTFLPTIS